ncbi:MAG: NAD-binding protein [Anaerolineales bacterium]|nr:NAD-binding protein [Anaerolineales bacterium]MCB9145049.1 NAD-binding protein [Anaerolineales bacterium]
MQKALFQIYLNRFILAIIVLIALLSIGTGGYIVLEGLSFVDALYMTVITLSTVGFGEVRELSHAGRTFTMGLIAGGVGVTGFLVSIMVEFVLSDHWRTHIKQRRMSKMLKNLSGHVIVCGFGRVGRNVAEELKDEGIPFVIIDKDPDRVAHAESHGFLSMEGNAAHEELLIEAGIERARAAVVSVNSDAENVFIILTIRNLNTGLFIVARANYEDSEPKLLKAGANKTIQPYRISGKRMVTMLIRPNVADFLDEVAHAGGMELLLEQIQIEDGSELAGMSVQEARLSNIFEVTVLARRGEDGLFHTLTGKDTILKSGNVIIAMGTRNNLNKLKEIAKG